MVPRSRPTRRLFAASVSLVALAALSGCEQTSSYRGSTDRSDAATGASTSNGGMPTRLNGDDGVSFVDISGGGARLEPVVSRGTGQLIAQSPGVAVVDVAQDGAITLSFVNTDIREVIDAIFGEALKLSYVIDPRVQGTVTVRTSQPLKSADIIPVLEDILSMNGAGLTKSGDTYRIIPLEQAATGFQREPGFGIHVIPLKYASVIAVRGILDPYVPPGRTLRADAGRNILIFSGTSTEAENLEELIQVFDVDWMAGMSFAIYPLQSAEAKMVVQELDRVFGQDFESPLAGIVQFVPIERQNAILVITAQPAYLDKAALWIERLDQGQEGDQQRAYVYWVQNGNAEDLAAILNDVYGSGSGPVPNIRREELGPGLIPAEITSYPGASRTETMAAPEVGAESAAPDAGGPEVAVEPARSNPLLPFDTFAGEGIPLSGGTNIRVVADERNNALVILATPVQYRKILATLRQLDVVPLQVLIEATIAEVTLNDDLKYGVQWFFNNGDLSLSLTDAGTALFPAAVVPGFNLLFDGSDARVVLSALAAVTDVRVISAPHLMVLDNEQARLQIGDQVPIATQSSKDVTNPNAPLVNTIEYRDTGVILDIIPHVNNSGLVTLDIIQEVSDVAETKSSGIDSPTIQQRQISSTVALQTGETVALGGLIRDRQSESESGLPLLSDIPLLGNLFKTTTNKAARTELIVLLTPRVVRNSQDARDLTNELRRRLPNVILLEERLKPADADAPQT